MTTGVPESDSYPDSGGRGWDVRPAVPGWGAGQDYTGPLFDDTGWHIDLSDVDWGDDAGRPGVRAQPASAWRTAAYACSLIGFTAGICSPMLKKPWKRPSARTVSTGTPAADSLAP